MVAGLEQTTTGVGTGGARVRSAVCDRVKVDTVYWQGAQWVGHRDDELRAQHAQIVLS